MNEMVGKEQTGDAKNMTMSHNDRIPPDPYAYLPQVPSFVLESNDARDGEPLDPKFAHSWNGGDLPKGAFHIRNDLGGKAFLGPAPPKGDRPHRYVFAVHALDVPALEVTEDMSPAFVGFNMGFHTLARAVMRPTFAL